MPSFTRRQMLLGGSALGVSAAVGGFAVGSATGWDWLGDEDGDEDGDEADGEARVPFSAHSFASRPDLHPPVVDVLKHAPGTDPGYVFITPVPGMAVAALPDGIQTGPMIIDNQGEPVWFGPTSPMKLGRLSGLAGDFRVQRYRGEPVLTYWHGELVVPPGYGRGEFVIMDSAYREIHTVRPAGGLAGDLHEFLITEDDTALVMAYRQVEAEMGPVYEGVIQELDIASGSVLFEWHSLDHVSPEESLEPLPEDPKEPYPYFHINSVEPDGDGFLVSARHTSAVYRIDRATGKVLWRLGGKTSDFTMLPGTTIKRQHDARRMSDGRVSIFDNGVGEAPAQSRAIVVELDEQAKTARLVREHLRPRGASAASQGNAQFLDSGHALVGWGSEPYVTEFTAAGNVLFDAHIGGELDSYRAYRMPWTGEPSEPPAVAAFHESDGAMTVHASWNGATEVSAWRILLGSTADALGPVTEVPKAGFETEAAVNQQESYAAVEALDAKGNVLGASQPVQPST